MKFYRFLLTLFVCSLAFAPLSAQKGEAAAGERLKEYRKQFIINELGLSKAEAEKFWPVYSRMLSELKDNRRKEKEVKAKLNAGSGNLSDADASAALDEIMALEAANLAIRKRYIEEFKKLIPIQKIVRIPGAERKFRKEILKRYRNQNKR